MELHVSGRHVAIPDDFREHAEERLTRLEHLLHGDRRADVVVTKDGKGDGVVTVEITLLGRQPVIRAEASDIDKTVAFDHAFTRLDDRIKKASERRRSGRRRVVPAGSVPPQIAAAMATAPTLTSSPTPSAQEPATPEQVDDDGPDVVELPDTPIEVRVKRHRGAPMTLEQAIYEMEMVGHDFYLFTDAASGLPSVMYRRRGWSYGVLHLENPQQSSR